MAAELYRLTRAWFDPTAKFHPKGSELLLTKKEAPASAVPVSKQEKADIKANEEEDLLLSEPELDLGDVKAGATLSSITKKAKS